LFSSFRRNEYGAALVEFAIAAALFTAMLLGILEFGFASWQKNSVVADAREGARYAMVRGRASGRIADSAGVANYLKSVTNLDNSIVVITTWPDGGKDAGKRASVTVKHAVPRRGPFIASHVDSSTSIMVILY
jgi:Flp pilus assembly protein TadG